MHDSKRSRLEDFSDGVTAIAITLLAIELKVPHLWSTTISGSVEELLPLLPSVLVFILSFVTIAIFWVNHHQLTQHLERVGKRVIWGNMLFLFFLSLIPFATVAIGENPSNPLAMLTYCLVLFGGSVSFTILRFFVHKKGEIHGRSFRRGIIGPLVYALAAIACLFSVWSAYALLAIPPLFYFLPRENKQKCDPEPNTIQI